MILAENQRALTLLGTLLCLVGCNSGTERYGDPYAIICQPGEIGCDGNVAGTCNRDGTTWVNQHECVDHTPVCVHDLGCVACTPDERRCSGQTILVCDETGSHWETLETCVGETFCYDGRCGGDCARAALLRSYEGCEYRAATLMNSQLSPDFSPAVVVSNRNSEDVIVTVTRGSSFAREVTVPSSSTRTIELDWEFSLKGDGSGDSANMSHASYRIVSTLPVTVYQFNPLEYGLDRNCSSGDGNPTDGLCFSYSNDASLLLPVHALTQHYMVMSRPNLAINQHVIETATDYAIFAPSVLAVVNPHEEGIDVTVLPSAPIAAGAGVDTLEAGEEHTFRVPPEGVLQLAAQSPSTCEPDWTEPEPVDCGGSRCLYSYCSLRDRDLTGTEITASAPVAVFGAHDCDFIPFNRWACDHLEEQIFPFETWGRHYVIEQAHRENGEPDLYRVLSGADGTTVTFDPEIVHEEVILDRGQVLELEAYDAFQIFADGPVLIGQFLVGQNYNAIGGVELPPGDPAFALVVPSEQWRSSYNFLAPSSFDRSFVNIVTSKDAFAHIELDGRSLADEDWQMVGRSDYVALRLEISAGSHGIYINAEDEDEDEDEKFGIQVYGYGQYTSYMYPGGLDLEQITVW